MSGPSQVWHDLPNGFAKTDLLRQMVITGSSEPLVRHTAGVIVANVSNTDHLERLRRLHRFVRDSVPYLRETVEMFAPATYTLEHGGDCDDHVILLAALAWSLRYPWIVEPVGDPSGPEHYSLRLGAPPSLNPWGDAKTTWWQTETTVPAQFGEPIDSIAERLGD